MNTLIKRYGLVLSAFDAFVFSVSEGEKNDSRFRYFYFQGVLHGYLHEFSDFSPESCYLTALDSTVFDDFESLAVADFKVRIPSYRSRMVAFTDKFLVHKAA